MIRAELDVSPLIEQLPAGTVITIVAPSSAAINGVSYIFDHWENGSISMTRIATLTSDLIVTAYYAAGTIPPTPLANGAVALAVIAVLGALVTA